LPKVVALVASSLGPRYKALLSQFDDQKASVIQFAEETFNSLPSPSESGK
jgi:hypothetical protein